MGNNENTGNKGANMNASNTNNAAVIKITFADKALANTGSFFYLVKQAAGADVAVRAPKGGTYNFTFMAATSYGSKSAPFTAARKAALVAAVQAVVDAQ